MMTATQKSTLSNDDSHTKMLTWQMAMMIATYSYTSLLGNNDRHTKSTLGNDDSHTKKLTR